jgi:transcriptional regulator with GAF, ATPase, and Fis domain
MRRKNRAKTETIKGNRKGVKKSRTVSKGSIEKRLQDAILLIDIAHTLTAPLIHAIENLLQLAARNVGSDEASVLVRDGNKGGLKFMVAIGEVADKLIRMRIPPGKGIAGFVFTSGQPVAIADVAEDGMFYAEVDRATGYTTQTIMATPLRVGEETIGVLEFVNRLGEPPYEPFTPDEMDRAAHFADAIAMLVNAHEMAGLVEAIFSRSVKAVSKEEEFEKDLDKWLKSVRAAPEHKDLISLAISLRKIACKGEAEREMCRDVLDALSTWTEKRSTSISGY